MLEMLVKSQSKFRNVYSTKMTIGMICRNNAISAYIGANAEKIIGHMTKKVISNF